ncbi:MAG TPA: PQQ-binding-like beta-propeller repeat protein, partial [Gemmataceae bacterium]|nr:PQQ-binding-like beta-propeller repeat protein [Gemmataceae bacterium]
RAPAMRYPALLLALLTLGCGVSGPTPAAPPADAPPAGLRARETGDDWPRFLGPQGTSVSAEKGILSPWPAKGPPVVWQKEVGVGYAMPSISRGRLFQFDRHKDKQRLSCLNAETGEFLWKYEYPTEYTDQYGYAGGPRCCPVVDDDRVYIYGPEGMLVCLGVSDGKMLWKVDTFADFGVVQNFFGVGSTPVVEKDLLIVQVGGSPKGSDEVAFQRLKGDNSGVVAFDKMTGKVKYRITDELASYSSPVLTTIGGRRWCFVFARGGLIGFDPSNGKVDFHFPWRARVIESVNASNPVVVGDRVLISETYGPGSALLKVKPGAAEVIWSDDKKAAGDKSLQCHWMTPVYHDGYVYGSSGRHTPNAELRCVELATGKVMWSEPGLTRCSLLMVDGHFVCLGEDGVLRLLKVNPKKHEEVSRVILRDPKETAEDAPPLLKYPCWAAPILSHGLLYVRGEGRLVCLELIPEKK